MKIISKFKDFYDYLAQDYDADITYVREAKFSDKLITDVGHIYQGHSKDKLHDFYNISRERLRLGDLILSSVIYGVYPNVYASPVLSIYCKEYSYSLENPIVKFLNKSFIDSLKTVDKKEEKKIFNQFALDCIKEYNSKTDKKSTILGDNTVTYSLSNISNREQAFNCISNNCRNIECKEIFYELKSPVFIEYRDCLDLSHTVYSPIIRKYCEENYSFGIEKRYLVDISLTAINPQIIKYWYDDLVNINTYNDIENFLWSIKQEPVSEPTNNQRIVNHGFDLKTSFRKM